MREYLTCVCIGLGWALSGLSKLLNALRGGSGDEALCYALGRSMTDGGWASRLWWPEWVRKHCIREEEPDYSGAA